MLRSSKRPLAVARLLASLLFRAFKPRFSIFSSRTSELLWQGKRKSVTGVRRRPKRTTTLRGYAVRSVTLDTLSSAYPMSTKSPRPRQLLSIRNTLFDTPQSRKREAYRAGKKRPGLEGARSSKLEVKHVSQDIIRSKWTILNEDAQAMVEELLRSIELPVLATYLLEQRKVEAQVALRSITGMLCKRLSRMPFPPKAKDIHFDYNTLVKDNRNLQQTLATSLRSRASLAIEVEMQKSALSSERRDIENSE